jgi:large subunit ribosomal protein L21
VYAIIKTGGKQYKVSEGTVLKVEKLKQEDTVEFKEVLMVSDGENTTFGTPYVDSASVKADILEHGRGKKVIVFKQLPRKNYRKKQGHRQDFTKIRVRAITTGGGSEQEEQAVEPAEALPVNVITESVQEGKVSAAHESTETSSTTGVSEQEEQAVEPAEALPVNVITESVQEKEVSAAHESTETSSANETKTGGSDGA